RADADALAAALSRRGYEVIGGGTDNHIVLFRVPPHLNGLAAERALESCHILVNKNKIPGDTRGATVASGVRLGSNTVALRRMGPEQMERCASLIDTVLTHARTLPGGGSELPGEVREQVVSSVRELCRDFPLPYAPATENLEGPSSHGEERRGGLPALPPPAGPALPHPQPAGRAHLLRADPLHHRGRTRPGGLRGRLELGPGPPPHPAHRLRLAAAEGAAPGRRTHRPHHP